MIEILTYLYVGLGVVLLFGAAVFVHEWGHYWVARKRGLKVEAFAIGFGPKIFGWTKDGIEYSWRWIPAGGYVKLPQMITSEAIEGKSEEQVPPASPSSKILVAAAGPFMNVVFAFVIATVIYFAGLPVLVNPSVIGAVEEGSQEESLGIRPGDRVVEVDGQPTRTWQEVQMATVLAHTNVLAVTIEKPDRSRQTFQLKAEVNPMFGLKTLKLYSRDHPEVQEVMPDLPGMIAGLQKGDIIVSFGGVPIVTREQLIDMIRKSAGKEMPVVVERDGKKVALAITPKLEEASGNGYIGVALGSPNIYELQRPGPTPWAQVADVWEKTIATLNALLHSKQTGVGIKDLSGPPGILTMLAGQLKTDFRLALSFLVLLNVNLAIINLFPVPVLDGGHILMAIVEKVRRRPLSVRFVEYTTTAFAILLISFMLYVSFRDVQRFRDGFFDGLFRGESRIERPENSEEAPGAAVPEPAP